MDSLSSLKKDWVLTSGAFDKLLASFDPDREKAAEVYEEIRRKLITFFEFRGCPFPADQTDETIDRVARRIHEGIENYARDAAGYFYGVARNVLREYWEAEKKEAAWLNNAAQSKVSDAPDELRERDSDRLHREQRFDCLETCIAALPPETREMIVTYYRGEKRTRIKAREMLAARLGVSLGILRMRACRVRNKLNQCINRCLRDNDMDTHF